MLRLAQVLLRRLDLGEDRRLVQRAEQRMERLPWHEVDGAVLDLHEHVRPELAVELRELDVGALGAVRIDILVVDERAPDDVAAVRRDRVGQAVRALGVIAAVVFRSGLSFGVGLDEETAEIRNQLVDFVRLGLPPGDDAGVERIGGLQAAETHRRGEVGREVDRAGHRAARASASAATFAR